MARENDVSVKGVKCDKKAVAEKDVAEACHQREQDYLGSLKYYGRIVCWHSGDKKDDMMQKGLNGKRRCWQKRMY